MRKILKYGICGLAAVMLLAGCSKKTDETAAAETSAAEETAAESGAAGAAADMGSVTLGEYKSLEIEGMSTEVTDEEVEEMLQEILTANPTYVEITERPAQLGDTVNIDYVGLKDGEAFAGGTAAGYDLELGSGTFIPGFEEGLVGAGKGDELSLNVTFPESYQSAELAGQAVVFDVTVNSIEEKQESELNESFVQTISDFTTVEEFRADVRAEMIADKEAEAEYAVKAGALQQAMDNSEFTCNPDAIQAEYDRYYGANESQATTYGMTLEQWLSAYGVTMEDFETQIREQAEYVVKQQLLVNAVAEAEGLEITDEYVQKVADSESMSVEDLISAFGQEEVDRVARIHRVVDFLAENAVVK